MIAAARKSPRLFTPGEVQASFAWLQEHGGADWIAVRRQTLANDDEARRVGARLMRRLHAAGLAQSPIEAAGLLFMLINRIKRDIALAGQIKTMLAERRRTRLSLP